jgi:hypothetical protein
MLLAMLVEIAAPLGLGAGTCVSITQSGGLGFRVWDLRPQRGLRQAHFVESIDYAYAVSFAGGVAPRCRREILRALIAGEIV